MSFAVWDVIWIVIGGLYGIMAVGWGIMRVAKSPLEPGLGPSSYRQWGR